MTNTKRDTRLEMRWLPVADSAGRSTMAAVWITVDAARPAATPVLSGTGHAA